MYEAEYMALTLTTQQMNWLTNTRDDLTGVATNAGIFRDNKATIDIAYNHLLGHESIPIDFAHYLGYRNIESGRLSHL
jgi:hypothetical protein